MLRNASLKYNISKTPITKKMQLPSDDIKNVCDLVYIVDLIVRTPHGRISAIFSYVSDILYIDNTNDNSVSCAHPPRLLIIRICKREQLFPCRNQFMNRISHARKFFFVLRHHIARIHFCIVMQIKSGPQQFPPRFFNLF